MSGAPQPRWSSLVDAWPVTLIAAAVVSGGALEFSAGGRELGINTIQFAVAAVAVGAGVAAWRARRLRLDLLVLPYAVLALVPILQALRDGTSPLAAGGIGRFVTVLVLLVALPQVRGRDGAGLAGWHVPVTLMGAAVGAQVLVKIAPAIGDPELGIYDLKDVVRLPFGNHNYVATVLAFALIVTLAAAVAWTWWRVAAVVLMGLGLFLTFSRGGWLAFGVALAVLLAVRRERISRRTVTVALGAAAGLALVAVAVAGDRVGDLVSPAVGPRLDLWAASWDAFVAHPILGVGVNRFPEWMTEVRQPYLHAHNTVLESLATTGLVGAAAYLTYLAGAGRRIVGAATADRLPLGLGLLVLVLHALVDSLNYLLVYEILVATLVGLAAGTTPWATRELRWTAGRGQGRSA